MRRIIFDTETTGLMMPSPAGIDRQPYITELFMCKLDEDYEVIEEYDQRFNIPFPIPDFITKITGITDKDLEGMPNFFQEAKKIKDFIESADETVAHNHAFDKAMVMNEIIRTKLFTEFDWPASEICTVQKSMSLEQRRISLTKLHEYMTGKGFEAHRAKADVYALIRCHHEMHERGML